MHTCFVITVSEDKENILQDWNIELTEKNIGGLQVSLSHVVHEFKTHCKTGIFNFTIIMLACPHARVNDEFELGCVKLKQRREAIQINSLKQFEKLNPVIREFVEVFVDHLQGTLEDTLHDKRHFVLHQILAESEYVFKIERNQTGQCASLRGVFG